MKRMIDWLNGQKSGARAVYCLVTAMIFSFIAGWCRLEPWTTVMLCWDAFCLLMITLSWITFNTMPQPAVREKAQAADESRTMSFVLILCSVTISLFGILLLMQTTYSSLVSQDIHRTISLLGVALSWGLLHTIFTLRYAHLYYAGAPLEDQAQQAGGLSFPNDDKPDYLDFAYFSFVLGMTFQVSDVAITSKPIRRVALLHSFIAFIFNTAILALTISILSSLGK